MNRSILKIALPAIVSNIAVPLLGLMDLTIAGHLGATAFIGAVAVGATMMNLTYWNFGFLRMGTSGLTAQAYGAGDKREAVALLWRSALLAGAIGLAIVAVQLPLQWALLGVIAPEEASREMARGYFLTCVWGAPALLATMSFSGWFIGMQNAAYPMAISITVNAANVAVSLLCVYALGMGFGGIAAGTVAAQWIGLLVAVACFMRLRRKERLPGFPGAASVAAGLRRFFRVNSDIFLRSLCVMAVTLFFTAAGARSGDVILAVNSLIMQLYILYSYFMDGFAYAGEALVGKHLGAADRPGMRRCVARLHAWGAAVMAAFAAAYGLFGEEIMSLLTDDDAVLAAASGYRLWAAAIPVAGMAAFVWDGVFIGLTATRQMLASLLVASAAFFAVYFLTPSAAAGGNDRLWLAFMVYMVARGAILTAFYLRRH